MPDITMCMNKECPLRNTCYRYTAIPKDKGQSYAEFNFVNGKCPSYMEMKPNKPQKEQL